MTRNTRYRMKTPCTNLILRALACFTKVWLKISAVWIIFCYKRKK